MNLPGYGRRTRIKVPAGNLNFHVVTLLNRNWKKRARDRAFCNVQAIDRRSRAGKAHICSRRVRKRVHLQNISAGFFDFIRKQRVEALHAIGIERYAKALLVE